MPASPSTRHVSCSTTTSSYSPELRRRADHLVELAAQIESALVMELPTHLGRLPGDHRVELCERLLERSLHQLHVAADDLRSTALRFRDRAAELDLAWQVAA